MADLTPDDELILRMADTIMGHIHVSIPRVETMKAIRTELLALGWRAPGPPTEEEVERAAIAHCKAHGRRWESLIGRQYDVHRALAHAALTAVFGRPE